MTTRVGAQGNRQIKITRNRIPNKKYVDNFILSNTRNMLSLSKIL